MTLALVGAAWSNEREAGAFVPVNATLTPPGEQVYPDGAGAWKRLAAWHAHADKNARSER